MNSEAYTLRQKIDKGRQRLEVIDTQIEALERAYDNETRAEERNRYQRQIAERKSDRQDCEQELQQFEQAYEPYRKQDLLEEANRLAAIESYQEAIDKLREASRLAPDDRTIASEAGRIQTLLDQNAEVNQLVQALGSRVADLPLLYSPICKRLREIKRPGDDRGEIGLVKSFLQGEITTSVFINIWEQLRDEGETTVTEQIDFQALAGRIWRAEMALFLGGQVSIAYDNEAIDAHELPPQLASQVNFNAFNGTLSAIAEYYQMRPEYGMNTFLDRLRQLLPTQAAENRLYQLISMIPSSLLIISTSYDTLLEQVLTAQGKKFALVYPVLGDGAGYAAGSIIVDCSDEPQPRPPCLGEALSSFPLLERGYTVIYKLIGSCTSRVSDLSTITLSERNHFEFARRSDRLVPSYLGKILNAKSLLFLGFSPRNWEDRLIASTVLDQRQSLEPASVIQAEVNQLEAAYWANRNVQRYDLALRDFVQQISDHTPEGA